MLAYNIPHFAAGDIETFLISVARAQGRIRKVSMRCLESGNPLPLIPSRPLHSIQHGDADVEAAAKTVLRDWAHNLFPYYTLPTKSEIEKSRAEITDADKKALDLLKPRQELKKVGKGLIRLKVPEVDERVVSRIVVSGVYYTLLISETTTEPRAAHIGRRDDPGRRRV